MDSPGRSARLQRAGAARPGASARDRRSEAGSGPRGKGRRRGRSDAGASGSRAVALTSGPRSQRPDRGGSPGAGSSPEHRVRFDIGSSGVARLGRDGVPQPHARRGSRFSCLAQMDVLIDPGSTTETWTFDRRSSSRIHQRRRICSASPRQTSPAVLLSSGTEAFGGAPMANPRAGCSVTTEGPGQNTTVQPSRAASSAV